MSLVDTASSGDRLETLRALRDLLARELEATASARDVAALSRQMTEVLQQIEDLAPPPPKVDPLAALIQAPPHVAR